MAAASRQRVARQRGWQRRQRQARARRKSRRKSNDRRRVSAYACSAGDGSWRIARDRAAAPGKQRGAACLASNVISAAAASARQRHGSSGSAVAGGVWRRRLAASGSAGGGIETWPNKHGAAAQQHQTSRRWRVCRAIRAMAAGAAEHRGGSISTLACDRHGARSVIISGIAAAQIGNERKTRRLCACVGVIASAHRTAASKQRRFRAAHKSRGSSRIAQSRARRKMRRPGAET